MRHRHCRCFPPSSSSSDILNRRTVFESNRAGAGGIKRSSPLSPVYLISGSRKLIETRDFRGHRAHFCCCFSCHVLDTTTALRILRMHRCFDQNACDFRPRGVRAPSRRGRRRRVLCRKQLRTATEGHCIGTCLLHVVSSATNRFQKQRYARCPRQARVIRSQTAIAAGVRIVREGNQNF